MFLRNRKKPNATQAQAKDPMMSTRRMQPGNGTSQLMGPLNKQTPVTAKCRPGGKGHIPEAICLAWGAQLYAPEGKGAEN